MKQNEKLCTLEYIYIYVLNITHNQNGLKWVFVPDGEMKATTTATSIKTMGSDKNNQPKR